MITLENISFAYAQNSEDVLKNISFALDITKSMAIIGESGSGKSTLLKLLFGQIFAKNGSYYFQDKNYSQPGPQLILGNKHFQLVTQDYQLNDYIKIGENIGQSISNFDLEKKLTLIDELLETVSLSDYKNNFPPQLSGGQKQRIAIAKAMAAFPKVLLLDEPFSGLDFNLKQILREKIFIWAEKYNVKLIFTTHDVLDAMGYSEKILILKQGELVQFDTPKEVYLNPSNPYVSSLFGLYNLLNSSDFEKVFSIELEENQNALFYPEEIQIAHGPGTEFKIIENRFFGKYYQLKVEKDLISLIINSPLKINFSHINIRLLNYRVFESTL